MPLTRSMLTSLQHDSSTECVKESRRLIRDTGDLVRGLTIEFEIELGLGPAVLPVGKVFEFASPQPPLRAGHALDSNAHARGFPRNAVVLRNRFRGDHDAVCDQALATLVLAREH